jgi:hypothetical protein
VRPRFDVVVVNKGLAVVFKDLVARLVPVEVLFATRVQPLDFLCRRRLRVADLSLCATDVQVLLALLILIFLLL